MFVLGLLTSNSGIALASAFGFLNAARSFRVYALVAVVTGVFSVAIGLLFVLGKGGVLPAIFGGTFSCAIASPATAPAATPGGMQSGLGVVGAMAGEVVEAAGPEVVDLAHDGVGAGEAARVLE